MLVLNGSASIADVVALADRREQVSVSPQVLEAVGHAHEVAAELSTRFATYGRTTGVGANRVTSVAADDTDYGMRLLRSHAVDAGDPLDARTVRAMLAVRLIQLCVPGAGLDPRILTGLETMLNDDALPELLQYASIGTGDLAPLAGTASDLDRRTARDDAVDTDGALGGRQRAAVHEQQRTDGRTRLPCAGRTLAARTSVERDLCPQFPRARRQSPGPLVGGRPGVGGSLRRYRRESPAFAVGHERRARPPPGPHPGPVRAAGVPGRSGERGCVTAVARGTARAHAQHGAGKPTLRHRK